MELSTLLVKLQLALHVLTAALDELLSELREVEAMDELELEELA